MSGHIFIGTSGWNYRHWSGGVFYPEDIKPTDWLRFYANHFNTVEINYSFYRLPERKTFEAWRRVAPPDFCFSVKASRFFTHMKKLLDPDLHAVRFLENAAGLAEKLGVILFQLPPRWGYNPDRLAGLLDFLSRQRIIPGVRYALEVRDPSWYVKDAFRLLKWHNVALVLADQPGFASEGPLTADFVFLRRHGPGGVLGSNYPEESLLQDTRRIRGWITEGRDVFIYFNNDPSGHAVKNAKRLKALLTS